MNWYDLHFRPNLAKFACVLLNSNINWYMYFRPNLAKFAWEMGTEPVTSAVAISRMFGSMASLIHRNEQYLKDQILEYKS